jgi:hypothetical protein
MRKTILPFLLSLLFGCANEKPDASGDANGKVTQGATTPAKKPIGSACVESDGWQSTADPAAARVTSSGEPVAVAVTDQDVDAIMVAPGILYCQEPGGVFPKGYMTSNCKEHSDCSAGTLCDDVHCRLPCKADSECTAPSVCGAPAGVHQVRFCSCNDCVHESDERGEGGK